VQARAQAEVTHAHRVAQQATVEREHLRAELRRAQLAHKTPEKVSLSFTSTPTLCNHSKGSASHSNKASVPCRNSKSGATRSAKAATGVGVPSSPRHLSRLPKRAAYTPKQLNAALPSGEPDELPSRRVSVRHVHRNGYPTPLAWLRGLKACAFIAVIGLFALTCSPANDALQSPHDLPTTTAGVNAKTFCHKWVWPTRPANAGPPASGEAHLLELATVPVAVVDGMHGWGNFSLSEADGTAVIDGGCTYDAWCDKSAFDLSTARHSPVPYLKVGNGAKLAVEFAGDISVDVETPDGRHALYRRSGVLYVPGLSRNLISERREWLNMRSRILKEDA